MNPLPPRLTSAVRGMSFVENYPANVQHLQMILFKQDVLDQRAPLLCTLVRNPDNEHDPNAIEVHCREVGLLGHLPRNLAYRLAPHIDAGERWYGEIERVRMIDWRPENPGLDITIHRHAARERANA